jgi:hypothetical protein
MSIEYLYKDRKGTVVDEYGRPEPMYYTVEEEQYCIEKLSSYTQCLSTLLQQKVNETDTMQTGDNSKVDTDVVVRGSIDQA